MDMKGLRYFFAQVGVQVRAAFEKGNSVPHGGQRGSVRESAVRDHLTNLLPGRYGVGHGHVITSEARMSRQSDVVIFDRTRCPGLLYRDDCNLFPVETVYGIVEVKSRLDSDELKDAHAKIAAFKRLTPKEGVTFAPAPGIYSQGYPARPVGIIFAVSGGRTLDAIAAQLRVLNEELGQPVLCPDYVVLHDGGLIGPREPVRSSDNRVSLPSDPARMATIHRLGKDTLFAFSAILVRELGTITLPPFDLGRYYHMPDVIDGRRVSMPVRLYRKGSGGVQTEATLSVKGVRRIVETCSSVPEIPMIEALRQVVSNVEQVENGLDFPVRLFNPDNVQPASVSEMQAVAEALKSGGEPPPPRRFRLVVIQIDDKSYAVDIGALRDEDWETVSS